MAKIQGIEVSFGAPVELERDLEEALQDIIDEICRRYKKAHPDRVMWLSGYGQKITFMPMTPEEEKERGMEFDDRVLSMECHERQNFRWPCAICGQEEDNHVQHWGHCTALKATSYVPSIPISKELSPAVQQLLRIGQREITRNLQHAGNVLEETCRKEINRLYANRGELLKDNDKEFTRAVRLAMLQGKLGSMS